MIKVYGCPVCGQLTIGSMRRGLVCPQCAVSMQRLELTFLEYTGMSPQERTSYGLRAAAEHGLEAERGRAVEHGQEAECGQAEEDFKVI